MLVDNPVQHIPFFSSPSFNDFNDIFNTDLFAHDQVNGTLNGSSSDSNSPSSSRASSPQSPFQSTLMTPPQTVPAPAFPDYNPSSFFNFLEDEPSKQLDPMMTMPSSAPYDFLSQFGTFGDMGIDSGMGMDINMDMSGLNNSAMGLVSETMGIDPQLVGTPSALSDIGEEDEQERPQDDEGDADVSASPESSSSAASPPVVKSTSAKSRSSKKTKEKEKEKEEEEKLTLVIQPVKVGGHGKARKGTVQSGGVVKKSASAFSIAATKDKENNYVASFITPTYTPPSAYTPTNIYPSKSAKAGSENGKDGDDEDDDLPQDWRPSPEVFQKMTSKEKRQLRNKISARNFRVRRKEYISTLEGDIAERDRLLDAIRTELGSTQSENYALRQEIATLKRTLLEGRGVSLGPSTGDDFPLLNLPPPAPLPAQSAAATLAQLQQQQQQAALAPPSPALATAQLLTANTQKDASANGRFWGGVSANGMRLGMGGITPVHRVVLPEVSVTDLLGQFNANREEKLQENMNPMLNGTGQAKPPMDVKTALGFDGFADVNPFTMKTLDAYRMHLWGKMAQQHHTHQAQQQQLQQQFQQQQQHNQTHLTGLASSLRPAFFASPTSLSALLSGKHTPAAPPYTAPSSPPPPYQSAPPSPLLGKSSVIEKLEREREREKERERERLHREHVQREKETAVYAALASQTLFRKMGGAFWDAFSGGSGSSAQIASGSAGGARAWDAEKVRRVLEGKAVVRVVDIEEPPVRTQMPAVRVSQGECTAHAMKCCSDILEESMRSLSIGKKA